MLLLSIFKKKISDLNVLVIEEINKTNNPKIDYKQAFEGILVLIDQYLEFIIEKIGLRVCCVCKRLFEDKSENLDFAPVCQECRNKSGKKN